ncbi:MAG: nitronate monooxygenase [Dehalococcoidia bacterium]
MWKTGVTDALGIQFPIIEGGMSMAGNGELAAAVSNAGGLGMIGSNPGWVPVEQRAENLRHHIRLARALTDKPFGVNFTLFVLREMAEQQMDVAIEEGVKVAVCSGGNPRLYTKKLKDAGMLVMHVVGNQRQAQAAQAAGVDIIIAEGYEAGGNNFPDELTTMTLIPYVVDVVDVPVVAAGGIADSRAFVAALALGAQGVQVGSAFIPTRECHVHQAYKEAVVAAIDTDTVIIHRALGSRNRDLKNPHSLKVLEMDQRGAVEEMKAFMGMGKAREGQFDGDTENGELSIGQVAGRITEIKSAGDVVRDIIGGASSVVERCKGIQVS